MTKTVFFGLLAIMLIFGFVGCSDSNDSPAIYTFGGTANGVTYVLIITDGSFELRVGNNTSTGTASRDGNTWTLQQLSGEILTVIVDSSGIVSITGTITFPDGTEQEAPGTVTPSLPGVDGSAIGDRLRINAPLYDYDCESGIISPFRFTGNLELESYGDRLFRWEGSDEYPLIVTPVINNRLSFDIGPVPTARLTLVSESLSSVPANARGILIEGFEGCGSDESYYFRLTNRNNVNQWVAFVYVDRDVVVSGVDWSYYWNLSLRTGWNSILFDNDRMTVTSFAPDENYIWLNAGRVGDFLDAIGSRIEIEQPTDSISGTINITVDGAFPAGGIRLEAVSWQSGSLGIFDISTGSNPVSWEFSGFSPVFQETVIFQITVYPEANRHTFFRYNAFVQWGSGEYVGSGNFDDDYWQGLFELRDVLLDNISITTKTVSVSVSGIGGNAVIYAGSRLQDTSFGMGISGNGTYNFVLPNNLGNWLWFTVVQSSGQEHITRGRLNAQLPVVLNTAAMMPR